MTATSTPTPAVQDGPADGNLDALVALADPWVNEVLAIAGKIREIAVAADAQAVVGLIDGNLVDQSVPMTIALIGERSRGKSSLLNALIGRPGLLPVDTNVTTNVYTELHMGAFRTVEADVVFEDGSSTPIRVADVKLYVSERENPENERGVRGVRLRCPLPPSYFDESPGFLHDVIVIDTPGLGGLIAEHADQAYEVVRRSDAILFVLEAKKLASEVELSFAARAGDTGRAAVLAAAKLDDVRDDPKVVLEQIREATGARAGALAAAPVVGVSALRWLRALAADDAEDRTRLAGVSGVPELLEALRDHLVAPFRRDRAASLLATSIGGLHQVRAADVNVLSTTNEGDVRQRLNAAQHALGALPNPALAIAQQIEEVDQKIARRLQKQVNALRRRLADEVRNEWSRPVRGRALRRELVDRWRAGLDAVWTGAVSDLHEECAEFVSEVSRRYELLAGADEPSNALPSTLPTNSTKTTGPVKDQPSRSGRIAHWSFVIGFPIVTVGLGAGSAISRQLTRSRQIKQADQNAALEWLADSAALAMELHDELAEEKRKCRRRLDAVLGGRIRAHGRALTETVAALENYAKVDLGAVRSRLQITESLVHECTELAESRP